MPREDNDTFEYDNLFVTKRKKGTSSDRDGDFVPMGTGRKSQYALGRVPLQENVGPKKHEAEQKQPPMKQSIRKKKKTHSDQKKPKTKKKPAASDSAKPIAKKTDAGKSKNQKTVVSSSVKSSGISKKAAPPKKARAKKRTSSSKKRSAKEEMLSYGYLAAMAVGGGIKKLFGSRRNRIITCVLLGIVILFCCYKGAINLYRSNSILTGSNNAADDTAARVKELTDEQNRDRVTYFLIVGVDKDKLLTDCIWVLCFDNEAHKMNVLQIPRDTYVGNYSISPHKANAIFESKTAANWCEKCDRAVTDDKIQSGIHTVCGETITTKQITGMSALFYFVNNELHLPVDYYVKFDFEGFEKAIDALGGIDIYLEKEIDVYYTKSSHITLPAGHNHLDGSKALKFMRNRKTYADGDLGRVKAQRQIIHAILEKVQDLSILKTLNVVMAANGSFATDMSLANIRSFIAPVKKCKSDDLHMFELPGEAMTVKRSSYYLCDDEKTVELLNEYMLPYSDKLNAGDIDFPDP